jgi:RNA polymerase sigma factor (sigma-70 family)
MEGGGIMDRAYPESRQASFASRLPPAEEALVALAKCGDTAAYTELCRRHSRMVFNKILRMTRNREDAEDVLQDASLRAFTHLNGFEGRARFSSWLTRIAINTALMMHRKRSSRFEQSIEMIGELGSSGDLLAADRTISAEDRMHLDERDRQIRVAIERLRPILRIPLELQIAEDLPLRDIASRLGISVAAAKSRLKRARDLVGSSVMKRQTSAISPLNRPRRVFRRQAIAECC